MSTVEQCEYDIRRYRNLKNKVSDICSKLSLASSNCESIKSSISKRYTINEDSTPIVNRTNNLQNNIDGTYAYLKNKVIPTIDNTINSLIRKKAELELEENS